MQRCRGPRWLAALATAVALIGCGGGDEPPPERADPAPTRPELTVPGEEAAPTIEERPSERTTSTTSPPPAPAPAPPTATQAPTTTAPPSTTAPDSPERDEAPPADSPAERFEKMCDENPGAC